MRLRLTLCCLLFPLTLSAQPIPTEVTEDPGEESDEPPETVDDEPQVPVVDDVPPALPAEPPPSPAPEPPIPPPAAPPPPASPSAPLPALDLPPLLKIRATPSTRDLALHLEAMASRLRVADIRGAELDLAAVEEARLGLGAANVITASALLIQASKNALETGAYPQAAKWAAAAARLSPDLPAAHWMRIKVQWAQDWAQLGFIFDVAKNYGRSRLVFRSLASGLSELAWLVGWALFGTIALFTALQLFKYLRYPAHDVTSRLGEFVGIGEIVLLALIVIGLPLALGLGPLLSPILALAMVGAYQNTRERVISFGFGLILAATPAILYLLAPLILFHGSLTDAMADVESDAFAHRAELRLETSAEAQADPLAVWVLAERRRRQGALEQAVPLYEKALGLDASNTVARNNLAVVLMALGREDAALAQLQTAVSRQDRAEPMVNLARLQLDRGNFQETNRLWNQARALDPRLTTGAPGEGSIKKLLAAPLAPDLLWQRLWAFDAELEARVMADLWRRLGGELPLWSAPLAVALAFFWVGFWLRRRPQLSMPCPKCGLPASRKDPVQVCGQCRSVYMTSLAVEPSVRQKKEREVMRYQIRRRRLERLGALVAGAGQILGERPFLGVMLLFWYAFAVAVIVFREGVLTQPWDVHIDGQGSLLLAGVAAFAALVLVVTAAWRPTER